MKCSSCGTELKEGARFCKACGCAVPEEKEIQVVEAVPVLFQEIKERLVVLEKSYADSQQTKTDENLEKLEKAALEKAALEEELAETRKELLRYQELSASLKEQLIQTENRVAEQEQQIEELRKASQSEGIQRCPNCHAEIDENTIFCGECGTKIR